MCALNLLMGKEKKPDLWWRMRGLDKMESRFGKNKSIEKFIKQRLKSEKVVRVLEFGFGEGKCLIDLRIMFPDKKVDLYGINDKKEGKMRGQRDFITNAKKFGLSLSKSSYLPKPFFYDAGKGLKFKSNFFDMIISQVAFPYVHNKAKLIEEFWRVLKPGGKAFIHIDSYEKSFPDFLQINKETPRFNIYDKGKLIKLSKHLNKFRKKGFNVKLKTDKEGKIEYGILIIEKNSKKSLKLGLEYDDDYSFDLYRFIHEKKVRNVWWGTRSVFKAK